MAIGERKPDRRRVMLGLGACLTAGLPRGGHAAAAPATAQPESRQFPLFARPGQRYLEDAGGKPFLIHGDSPWSLIADLKREDAETYLEDRRQRGFNAILVNLLEHKFASRAPANAYGVPPFSVPGDFSTPKDDYFVHVDWVLRRAEEKGLLVLLAAAYLGVNGGDEGWYRAMVASGPAKLNAYGRFLGQRYRTLTNILWVHGGDYNPPRRDLVRAVVDGIREFDKRSLHTAHCGPGTAALDYWRGESWLQVNTVYTYEPVHQEALKQYARPERMPFILLESVYENEHGAGELRVRNQAYSALLAGACGQVFGNNPIWHFDGPGLEPAPAGWRRSLSSRGADSMGHLRALMASLPWWTLEPDTASRLIPGANSPEHVPAALSRDRALGLVYLPSPHPVAINLGALSGSKVTARWHDPRNGLSIPVSGSPFPTAAGSRIFDPTQMGKGEQEDWVLVLTSASES